MATRTLEIVFVGDSKQAQEAISQLEKSSGSLEGKLGGLKSAFTDVAKVAGGVLIAEGISKIPGFLVSATQAAIEDEAAWRVVEQAVRNASGAFDENIAKVRERIQEGQRLAYTDSEIQNSFTALLAATGDVDEALRRQVIAMDLARGSGMSLEQASRMVGKVNDENVQAFKRLGITIREGATEAEALAAVQAKFAGQAETYASSTAGQFEQAKIRLGEVKEQIGYYLLPVVTELATIFLDKVVPAIEKFVTVAGPVIRKFVDDVRNYWESDLKPAIDNMIRAWEAIEPVVRPLLEFLGDQIMRFVGIFKNAVQLVVNLISGDWSGAWDNAKEIVRLIWESIKGYFESLFEFFKQLIPRLLEAGKALLRALRDGIWEIWDDNVKPFLEGLPGRILDFIKDFPTLLFDAGKKLITGLWDGMKAAWGEVSGWLSGLKDVIKGLKGPEKEDKKALVPEGMAIVQGLQAGAEEEMAKIGNVVSPTFVGGQVASTPGGPVTVNLQIDSRTFATVVLDPWIERHLTSGAMQYGVVP